MRLIAALAALLALTGCDSAGDPAPNDGDWAEAQVACRDFVRDRLKAPSTADFSDEVTKHAGRTWRVTGSVDAENSFGAKLRESYTCRLRYDGKDYRLLDLTGLD